MQKACMEQKQRGQKRYTMKLTCPRCDDSNIARNGKKSSGTQNYLLGEAY